MTDRRSFQPNWASPPGATIADILHARKVSLSAFAEQIGQPPEGARALLDGRAAVTDQIAARLAEIAGASAKFWLEREAHFRANQVRLDASLRQSVTAWLRELPIRDMMRFGWLDLKANSPIEDRAAKCLRFFGAPDVATWQALYENAFQVLAFRTSSAFESRPGAVAAWIRQGEIEAASIDTRPWNSKKFLSALADIRHLTRKRDPRIFLPALRSKCAECGVAMAIVRAPSGCRASGVTRFISPRKAIIQLSFRYRSDDHFWFTFFHEAAHLLLHGRTALFFEGQEMAKTHEEEEADAFAADFLVSKKARAEMLRLGTRYRDIMRFAKQIGVSPGIVVGQMQHAGYIRRNQLNFLKTRFDWDTP